MGDGRGSADRSDETWDVRALDQEGAAKRISDGAITPNNLVQGYAIT
jgi:hypothetical protein